MTTQTSTWEQSAERQMGDVYADITIRNHIDVALAARGLLPADAVREIHLERVMVDTGASLLCLPAALVARLGLPHVKDMPIETASGLQVARMFEDAEVSVSRAVAPRSAASNSLMTHRRCSACCQWKNSDSNQTSGTTGCGCFRKSPATPTSS